MSNTPTPSNSVVTEAMIAKAKVAFEQGEGLSLEYSLGNVILAMQSANPLPVPMILTCPACGERHIDEGEFATKEHHTHACQGCGMVWRPALVPTVGVQFLPGFKNGEARNA